MNDFTPRSEVESLVDFIVAKMEQHPEIALMEGPFDLYKIDGMEREIASMDTGWLTLATAAWALSRAQQISATRDALEGIF